MRLRPTDIPEQIIAMHAKMLGIDPAELVDGLVFKGDNVFFPADDGMVWVWSREDLKDWNAGEWDDSILDDA